jgi:hypothetical protein
VSEQTIDNVDVAVLSGPPKGVDWISAAKQLARVEEHALHIGQSTTGSVITECLKFDLERHSSIVEKEERSSNGTARSCAAMLV